MGSTAITLALVAGAFLHGAAPVGSSHASPPHALAMNSAGAFEVALAGAQEQTPADPTSALWQEFEELDSLQPDLERAAQLRDRMALAIAVQREDLSPSQLGLVFRAARAAALWLEFDGPGGAIALQHLLHQKNGADWTAVNLALSLERVGDFDGAEAVLNEQAVGWWQPSPMIMTRQGLGLIARGRIEAGRARLSIAMARGSDDAEITLARLDLSSGRRLEALRGFSAVLSRSDAGAWSRRGYGMALLGPDPVLTKPSPASHDN